MNIRRAKDEIKNTIEAYLLKDEDGEYAIPVMRQRPIFLIGAPGIGKTQIMEQIAKECGIALVSYTITHHTRQSAIGLPFISDRKYGDTSFRVTEYTMSEIVASIYRKMEQTGLSEGILFLDEINCVSETLAPAMLQFLQYKTFGGHRVPDGWIIVTAGNPPEYNKSVRDFDVVTMDRVKKIEVEPDFEVWNDYAGQEQIHPAIRSYLTARQGYFYRMETTVDGRSFATPRGWEDLSRFLSVYERLGKKMDREVVIQYIQHEKIAKDFANYLELFEKYQMDYQMDEVLSGHIDDGLKKKASHASFDEKLGVVSILLSRCSRAFADYSHREEELRLVFDHLERELSGTPEGLCDRIPADFAAEYERLRKAELLTRTRAGEYRSALRKLEEEAQRIRVSGAAADETCAPLWKEWFEKLQDSQDGQFDRCSQMLEYAFDFMETVYGNGQEMVIFVTELNTNPYCVRFLQDYECERYYYYNKNLLFDERSRDIENRLMELQVPS